MTIFVQDENSIDRLKRILDSGVAGVPRQGRPDSKRRASPEKADEWGGGGGG